MNLISVIKWPEKSHNKSFHVSILMIKLQGIDKLQHCSENFALAGARNNIEINNFSIDMEI